MIEFHCRLFADLVSNGLIDLLFRASSDGITVFIEITDIVLVHHGGTDGFQFYMVQEHGDEGSDQCGL